ncbi:MAG: homoserine dehydrogenase [Firmicutes bacterium]|nr:homoserine dehydrogenase [Bacillota bacterium]
MIHIAVLGFGVVGGGVVEVMEENASRIARSAAEEISVKYILDVRDFPENPWAALMVQDFSVIENDPDVRIVVETIGGAGVAYDFTKRALLHGKSVVTSNKELVATRGLELIRIAKERNVNYLFEASVGGGIPIIRPITQCLAANEIDEVYGILNGTTNYILTRMIACGVSFDEALKQAQEKGYAEKDPSADLEGLDACRKICILSDLCFGREVDVENVKTEGIAGVKAGDVESAKRLGYKIKLLGRGLRTGKDTVTAYVAPHLIPVGSLLSNVDGVMNGIVVHGNAIGEAMFYGAGAGKRPTASAVVADVIDAAKHFKARKYLDWDEASPGSFTDSDEVVSRWYVRAEGKDACLTEPMSKYEVMELTGGQVPLSLFRVLE